MAASDTADRFFRPEIGARLDEALGLYQELARADKNGMRQEAAAIAAQLDLAGAAQAKAAAQVESVLRKQFAEHPSLVSLTLVEGDKKVASVDRKRPVT